MTTARQPSAPGGRPWRTARRSVVISALSPSVLGSGFPMLDASAGGIIRLTHIALTAAVGSIMLLAAACADEPAPPARLGPHDGFDLPPVEPGRVALGDIAPDFTLRAHDGRAITLSDYRSSRDILLVFYRGHW
jgi:hypothetical protein